MKKYLLAATLVCAIIGILIATQTRKQKLVIYDDLLQVDAPLMYGEVTSPLTVTGKARGPWYFEASFPVTLYDANDILIAQGHAQAIGDWMTEEYVPFQATLAFSTDTPNGTLVLENDNPSGLPENHKEVRIPLAFTPPSTSESVTVQLFYYRPESDQGPGGAQCSKQGLVAVERSIPKTQTPLKDAITLLLAGEITPEEKANGITTEFPLLNVHLVQATISDGVATLTFNDPQHMTDGGACRVSILRHQIEATAKQFPSVTSVRLMPEELFQP